MSQARPVARRASHYGPVPLHVLEGRILAGDVNAVMAINSATLGRVMRDTRSQAVAAIILDIGEEQLIEKLLGTCHHGHLKDDLLKYVREKEIRDVIRRLRKVVKF